LSVGGDDWAPATVSVQHRVVTNSSRHRCPADFEEAIKGTVTPGKLADLDVLSGDPRAISPEELPSLSVDVTVVDGRVVYER
jgi:hypothetical protein